MISVSWPRIAAVVCATLGAIAFASTPSCNGDIPPPATCKDIPAGGCPSSFGEACNDPTCAAVYTCTDSGWAKVRDCAGYDAAVLEASAPKDAGAEATGHDADVDAPGAFGGPGCMDLELPDCPLGIALSCSSGCCGCEDLFTCVGGAWNDWGVCGEGGAITPSH